MLKFSPLLIPIIFWLFYIIFSDDNSSKKKNEFTNNTKQIETPLITSGTNIVRGFEKANEQKLKKLKEENDNKIAKLEKK